MPGADFWLCRCQSITSKALVANSLSAPQVCHHPCWQCSPALFAVLPKLKTPHSDPSSFASAPVYGDDADIYGSARAPAGNSTLCQRSIASMKGWVPSRDPEIKPESHHSVSRKIPLLVVDLGACAIFSRGARVGL
eukprot:2344289-Rhodomonas_salina.2